MTDVVGMKVEKPENHSEGKAVMHHIMELFDRSLATLQAIQCSFPNLLFFPVSKQNNSGQQQEYREVRVAELQSLPQACLQEPVGKSL